MSVKIIRFDRGLTNLYLVAVAIVCVAGAWYFAKWNFANMVASAIDIERPEARLVADPLIQMSPDDPQTHSAAARIFEKTFDANDLTRSLGEYGIATGLSPNNYLFWLDLGKARDGSGDQSGAEVALHRALDLAPNYAAVQWAYGNSLIRHGKTDEGFALVAKAATSGREYSSPAVAMALQIFDGDTAQVRRVLGDTPETNAGLASVLAAQTRYDDAAEAWVKLAADDKRSKYKQMGDKLAEQLAAAKKFNLAARVTADLVAEGGQKPLLGEINNGGFENGVKLRSAGIFEWQIAEGATPQIGLSEGEKHAGRFSLSMSFNTIEPAAFRPVTQTVAVVPGAAYEFEAFYRSDLKTMAAFKWEIGDGATGVAIASTAAITPAADWTPLKVKFTVPAGSDGVVIRFVREGCAGGTCAAGGKLSFDDLSIKRL